jgi:predicted nucleotidyltransferase
MLHKKLPKKVQQIVQEAKEQLQAIYSGHLQEMILFGSYARGDYTKGSDIDLLILVLKYTSFLKPTREYC